MVSWMVLILLLYSTSLLCKIMFNKVINYLVDKLYDGNFVAFKSDPIVGTSLSVFTIWGVDYHFALTKLVGTGVLALMSVAIGVIGPMAIRLWMHRLKTKYPIVAELLKHDKKDENSN